MREVAVHHVAEKAMEQIEPAFVGGVRRVQSQVPLAHDRGVVPGPSEFVRQGGDGRIEIAPRICRVGADHAGYSDPVGIAAREQCRARRRAHRGVGAHRGEAHPLGREAIDVRRADIGRTVGRDVAVTVIVGEDDQEVRLRASRCEIDARGQEQHPDSGEASHGPPTPAQRGTCPVSYAVAVAIRAPSGSRVVARAGSSAIMRTCCFNYFVPLSSSSR